MSSIARSRAGTALMRCGLAAAALASLAAGCAPDAGSEADGSPASGDSGLGDAVFEVRRDPG